MSSDEQQQHLSSGGRNTSSTTPIHVHTSNGIDERGLHSGSARDIRIDTTGRSSRNNDYRADDNQHLSPASRDGFSTKSYRYSQQTFLLFLISVTIAVSRAVVFLLMTSPWPMRTEPMQMGEEHLPPQRLPPVRVVPVSIQETTTPPTVRLPTVALHTDRPPQQKNSEVRDKEYSTTSATSSRKVSANIIIPFSSAQHLTCEPYSQLHDLYLLLTLSLLFMVQLVVLGFRSQSRGAESRHESSSRYQSGYNTADSSRSGVYLNN